MGLLSFKDWLESSASTRNKTAAALGLQPMYSADVFGHSTPAPWIVEKLTKKLKKKKKKTVSEGKAQRPDYSFDTFIAKASKAAEDTDKELAQAEKEVGKIDKESEKKKDEDKSLSKKVSSTNKGLSLKTDFEVKNDKPEDIQKKKPTKASVDASTKKP